MRTAIGFVFLVGIVGCADEVENLAGDRPAPAESVAVQAVVPGEQDQGKYLLGEVADDLEGGKPGSHISANAAPVATPLFPTITRVRAINGTLHAFEGSTEKFSGGSGYFEGMVLSTPTGAPLTITNVVNTPAGPEYILDAGTPGSPVPYCSTGGAIVVSGYWETNGLHQPDVHSITFTCKDGVIRKCMRWGYRPPDAETSGLPNDPWTAHQACTRMARADYCSNGDSHTLEETGIVIRDLFRAGAQPDFDDPNFPQLVSPMADPAPPDRYWFEAIWRGGSDPVLCLFKERWKSLPFGGHCAGIVDDPRTVQTARFCDDLSHDVIANSGILFNSSKVGLLTLNRWYKGADQLVTVRGVAGTTTSAEPPFPGYQFLNQSGDQIGLLMRNPPGSLTTPADGPDPDLLPIFLQTRAPTLLTPGDRVVSFDDNYTNGYMNNLPSSFEGFVYARNDEGLYQKFNLYRKTGGSELVTDSARPNGYTLAEELGFIDPFPVPVP